MKHDHEKHAPKIIISYCFIQVIMQDKILRRVWDFDVNGQAYKNICAGHDLKLRDSSVFYKMASRQRILIKWNRGDTSISQIFPVFYFLTDYSVV